MIKNMIFLGAPGSGKGTLAQKYMLDNGTIHISTGDIFRSEMNSNSELGQQIKSIVSKGELVSDDITNAVIKKRLSQNDVKNQGFLLDGYPRTINQAEFLLDNNLTIDAVILLDANKETIVNRLLKRARADDKIEIIEKRFDVYELQTKPLINFYEQKSLIKRVDCNGSIDENFTNLIEALK